MDFPSQYPESPAKPLAGAARARVLARQNRTSSLKPYARRQSSGLAASCSVTSLHTDTDSPARTPSTPNTKTLAPLSTQPTRSAFSPLRAAAAPIALLGSVRKMVTKPLSWLTSVASAVEPELGIPTSSSTNSLSSIARKRAAAQASIKSTNNDSSYERDAPTRAARAVGERLAAGLLSRSNLHDDEENQLRPPTSTLSSSTSMSRFAPAPAPARATRHQSPFIQDGPAAGPSAPSRSIDKPITWSSRSSKRTLDVGARPIDDDRSIDAMSDVSRTSPSRSHALHSRSQHALRSPRSQMLGYRGSSLRPDDAMSESGSTSLSHSHSFSAFGYGNEIRYTDSAFGLPPSNSPFQLSSRNTLGRRTRAPFSSGLFTETGTPGRTSRAGSVSVRGASPAPSAGYSPARHREGTPQRRNWNGVNLAAPSVPSVGDEMMREYLASRTLPGINPSVRRNLGLSTDEPMITSSSVAGGSVIDETISLTPSRLGKRDIDMSVDGDSERLGAAGTPSKRRMVWHPELGFISHEELKAREPKLPSPKNEAERLLNVLETLRKPTPSARGAAQAKGASIQIHVPAPISDLPSAKTARSQEGKQTISVAPYTRYLRKAKTVQSADQQGGMRAKLKKIQRANVMDVDDAATDDLAVSENEDAEQDAEEEKEQEEAEEEAEEEDEPAPPQPEPVRRSRRLQHQAPTAEEVVQTPVKQAVKPARANQLKSALKATPLRAATQPQATPARATVETPKPASHRIPLSAATKAPSSTVKKDNFVVKSATDPTAPRERSSLRQGAAKTSRTHQSSGKFSAWDEDEDEEDLPEAGDLAKIKLPTNMFPSGFSFGSSASAETAASSKAAPSEPTAKAVDSASSSSDGSLLGRLGGFDSSAPSSQTEKNDAPKSAAAAPSFSFSAPSKDAPTAMPKFSFGASASNTTSKDGDSSTKKSAAPPASDFFSKPVEPASKSLDEAKKDGPVPNFFGSTMKKFESKPADAPAAPAATGGFSFGASAASGKTSDGAASSKPASFSFGAPKPTAESASTPAPTSDAFGSFGAKSTQSAEKKAESAAPTTASFFGSSSASSSSAGGFSFGAPSTPSATTGSKRGADDEDEPAAKKSMPSFSFGTPAAAPSASKPAGSGFSFGAPAAASGEKKDDGATTGMPNFFGAKGDDAAKPGASTTSGGFSFGKPASDSASGGFGASKPADPVSSGGFTFGSSKPASTEAPKPPSTSGFTFGAPSTNTSAGSSPAPESKPAASTSTFTFGAPQTTSSVAAAAASPATSAPASGATTPNGTFTFGAPAGKADTSATSKSASSGFSFGAPAASGASTGFGSGGASTTGFGGFGAKPTAGTGTTGSEMMDDSPQKNLASTPSAPSFTFGSATPSTTPAKPAGMSFTFGSPATSSTAAPASGAPAASSSSSTFTFGAPANNAPASNGGFRFGSPAPATSSAPSGGGFTFGSGTGSTTPGVGSTPASPFLAPTGAPTTPGGSPFQFGSAAPANSSAPFQFGAPAPQSGFGFGGAGAAPSTPGFGSQPSAPGFGAPAAAPGGGFGGAPTTPTAPGAGGASFSFGATPNGMSGMPQLPQMQAQPGLFSMGAPPSGGAGGSPATPGGRQIKPLRQRRR